MINKELIKLMRQEKCYCCKRNIDDTLFIDDEYRAVCHECYHEQDEMALYMES
jgi:hypothetical protein